MGETLKSYTSTQIGFGARVREMINLGLWQRQNIPAQIRTVIERLAGVERVIFEHTGVRIENLDMLEIGPGQKLLQMGYFARSNRVIAIDLDKIVQGFDVLGYWDMLRRNGLPRSIKTIGRRALGIDRKFLEELKRQLGVITLPKLEVLAMDATQMTFPDNSFDFVISLAVMQSVPNPAAMIDNVARVLRPGGVAYLSLHLFTSDNGCCDPRIFRGERGELPHWSHLRPKYQALVQSNAYLNELRMKDWKALFEARMPGAHFESFQYDNAWLQPSLAEIRKGGELADYTDDELLTVDFAAVWKKPLASGAAAGAH